MEEQPQHPPQQLSQLRSPEAPSKPRRPSLAQASSSNLRFPNLDVDDRIAYLVSTSTHDIMNTPPAISDVESLADSAYEIISSADDESQDGRRAESLAEELDIFPRSDDVHSLSNDKGYDDDDEDDEEGDSDLEQADLEPRSRTDSLQYAEEALENTSTISSQSEDSSDERGTPMSRSIEFLEADSTVSLEKTSVKHTIKDFSEDQSETIAMALGLKNPPKRLAATIRQTMSYHCLSTREPLRVLYVGSEAGRTEITHKISSAFLASRPSGRSGEDSTESDGVYNIVPIAAFGASKVPERDEIQLMNVSDYYIKLDRCTSAEEVVYEGDSFPLETVYSITIDEDKTYTSAYYPSGSVIQPKWTLPHVAIFYLCKNDDEKEMQTRNAAWEFMTRHGIPSIFISHAQTFEVPSSGRWIDFVDQGAVHLCLESRDPDRSAFVQRLPIDLASFLNIDARQMNRNLAYLTGLYESPTSSGDEEEDESDEAGLDEPCSKPLLWQRFAELQHLWDRRTAWSGMALAVLSTFLFFGFASLLMPYKAPEAAHWATPAADTLSIPDPTTLCSVPTVTPTVTISFVSTKTVLSTATASSTTASFGGFLSDKPQASVVEPEQAKKMACSIEVFSENEILVKIPGGTKTSWLARGAVDIDVWRGTEMIKSKLSSTDEGIVIEISKKDAYGVMNVSVVTTRRPKINESFAIDFGKPALFRLFDTFDGLTHAMVHKVADTANGFAKAAGNLRQAGKGMKDEVVHRAKDSFNAEKLNKALRTAQGRAAERLRETEHLRDEMNLKLLRAQVASKLWWLKVQRKDAEYTQYEAKSSKFLKQKEDAIQETRALQPKKEFKFPWGRRQRAERTKARKACKGKGKWRSLGCEI